MPVQVRPWAPALRLLAAFALGASPAWLPAAAAPYPREMPLLAYPFSDQGEFWINSGPIHNRDLDGPALVFFWTYGCHNCRNTLAWINAVHAGHAGSGLRVLGIHSPEFAHERNRANVRRKVAEYGIEFPVMLDSELVYWSDMKNEWWPAFHLYDRRGRHVVSAVGEIHAGTPKAAELERHIAAALAD